MQPHSLLLIGSGGFARETVELVRAADALMPSWALVGLLDDDPSTEGRSVAGTRVLGSSMLVSAYPDAAVVACVGSPRNIAGRARLVERLGLDVERFATLVHPAATVPASCHLGVGSVVHAGSVWTTDVTVGRHVAVMPSVVLTHDVVVEDFCTFASGVLVGGGARIRRGTYLGAGAVVRDGISVGPWALIGAGAVVTRDVPAGEVWVGNPARRLRDVEGVADLLGPAVN